MSDPLDLLLLLQLCLDHVVLPLRLAGDACFKDLVKVDLLLFELQLELFDSVAKVIFHVLNLSLVVHFILVKRLVFVSSHSADLVANCV